MPREPILDFLRRKGYLTINQFQTLLREDYPRLSVTFPTIKRWIEKGHFKAIQVGGQYRIDGKAIWHYLKYGTDGIEDVYSEGASAPSTSLTPVDEKIYPTVDEPDPPKTFEPAQVMIDIPIGDHPKRNEQ